jgi:phytol kinase
LIAGLKWLPPLRARAGGVIGGEDRTTLGEIYFPIAVAVVFWLSHGQSPLLFCIPILVLTFADATGALIGLRYGRTRFTGAPKSAEGSIAVALVTFFCVDVPLVVWSDVGRVDVLLMAATLALLVMLLEGSAWRGLDNLFIPIGVYFLLHAWLNMGTAALLARFLVTVLLVSFVVARRRTSTLQDDALLAAAFLGYVTWALLGWRWLLPPATAFVGFAWMSPRTEANSRRIHDVSAVLAVWGVALIWLTIARLRGEARLIYPFTLVFAGHVAIFGASRMAGDFPARRLLSIVMSAVTKSWLMFFVPFLLIFRASPAAVMLALVAVLAIGFAVELFVWTGPPLHTTDLAKTRWIRQAVSAGVASAIGWVALHAFEGWGSHW